VAPGNAHHTSSMQCRIAVQCKHKSCAQTLQWHMQIVAHSIKTIDSRLVCVSPQPLKPPVMMYKRQEKGTRQLVRSTCWHTRNTGMPDDVVVPVTMLTVEVVYHDGGVCWFSVEAYRPLHKNILHKLLLSDAPLNHLQLHPHS
jgi:hypothetical protein